MTTTISGWRRLLVHYLSASGCSTRTQEQLRTSSVQGALRMRAQREHWESLNHAGFIEFSASQPRARARARSRETEKEKEPPLPPQGGSGKDLSKDLQPSARELRRYTGCRWVRGQTAATHKYDPLGIDKPPANWPYEKPSKAEILNALDARKRDEELGEMAERQYEDEVEAAAEEINF